MSQMDMYRTLCHDGNRLSQVIIKPSNSLDISTVELNVTLTLLVMVIIWAKPFKSLSGGDISMLTF